MIRQFPRGLLIPWRIQLNTSTLTYSTSDD